MTCSLTLLYNCQIRVLGHPWSKSYGSENEKEVDETLQETFVFNLKDKNLTYTLDVMLLVLYQFDLFGLDGSVINEVIIKT